MEPSTSNCKWLTMVCTRMHSDMYRYPGHLYSTYLCYLGRRPGHVLQLDIRSFRFGKPLASENHHETATDH